MGLYNVKAPKLLQYYIYINNTHTYLVQCNAQYYTIHIMLSFNIMITIIFWHTIRMISMFGVEKQLFFHHQRIQD